MSRPWTDTLKTAQVVVEFVAVAGAVSNELLGKALYESRGKCVVDELRSVSLTTRSPHGATESR